MDPLSWIQLIVMIACFIGECYFSLICHSLLRANQYKIQIKADEGKIIAKIIIKIINNKDRVIIPFGFVLLALINTGITCGSLLLYRNFNNLYLSFVIAGSWLILSVVVDVLIIQTLSRRIPDTISYYGSLPFVFFSYLFFPIEILLEKAISSIKVKPANDDEPFEEELQDAVEQVSDELIDEEQTKIIQSVLDFDDKNVKEILTPKEKIFALDITTLNHSKIKDIILSTTYSRIPVYEGEFDNCIGVLIVKTYLKETYNNPRVSIRSLLQKPYFVSSKIMVDDLFHGFKKHHTHIALVRNNKKEIIGMVTMEDVLEELVSDISEPNKGGSK